MKKALVIDDNRVAADILCHFLTLLDVDAHAAYGSRPAIIMLKEQTPDIIFLDLNMPGVNGFEVLKFLQRDPNTADIPVVFVTSDDQKQTADQAKKAGALALLVKPATIEGLEEVLKLAKLV